MKNKGQISLEFLTTYGWALLILAIMIGGFSYVMLRPDQIIPASCTFPDKLQCIEHSFTTDYLAMNIKNFDSTTINISKVSCKINNIEYVTEHSNVLIRPGGEAVVNCSEGGIDSALFKDELVRSTVLITYRRQGFEFPTITQGNVVGLVVDLPS